MSIALTIQPHDVLLFRDGKPFSAGTDARAQSLFPPTPFTIQGAIRARVLFSSDVHPSEYAAGATPAAKRLQQLIGKPGPDYGQLRLKGPFLSRWENNRWVRYFPLPVDVIQAQDAFALLQPLKDAPWQSNIPEELQASWVRTTERIGESRGWIDEEDLRRYLKGDAPQKVLEETAFVEREHRFGIAIDTNRRTVQESYLYLVEFLRLKGNAAFWIEVDGISQKHLGGAKGFLQLGGEARAACYAVEDSALNELLSPPDALPRRFKVTLLTPAWFSAGWKPANWSSFFNGPVRLISAIIPRYQAIGGAYVDDKRRKRNFHKPMYRFVPAGSVYFFEHDGQNSWSGRPFTETPAEAGDYGQIGFGTCVISTWNDA